MVLTTPSTGTVGTNTNTLSHAELAQVQNGLQHQKDAIRGCIGYRNKSQESRGKILAFSRKMLHNNTQLFSVGFFSAFVHNKGILFLSNVFNQHVEKCGTEDLGNKSSAFHTS